MTLPVPRLMVVLDQPSAQHPVADVARAAINGGADLVQVREKNLDRNTLRALVISVLAAVGDPRHVSINGDAPLAAELGINVHLPERVEGDRMSLELRENALLGRSIHSADRAWTAAETDYLILGNLLETASKPGKAGLGAARFSDIARQQKAPVLAIGGIRPDTMHVAREAGAFGVAVSSYVNAANDPERATRAIKDLLDSWTTQANTQ